MKFPRFCIVLGLAAYVLAVGYGLVFRDVEGLNLFFGLPVGVALVVGLLFLLGYEILAFSLPFLADTLLIILRLVLPRGAYRTCESRAFDYWQRTPKILQRSLWMQRRYEKQNSTGSEPKQ